MIHLQIQRALALIALLGAGHGHHIHHGMFVQSLMLIVPFAILGLTQFLIILAQNPHRHCSRLDSRELVPARA